ncbi:MAG TPA: DNA-processing protein DprA [Solirubrobacteraceae bacterium]|nr:DNA-processing protein DprA [Solirubrobacteraceae bacterium]
MNACDRCLARGFLLEALAGHLETQRWQIDALLALPDHELLDAVGGHRADAVAHPVGAADAIPLALGGADAEARRARVAAAGLEVVCRCSPLYPRALLELEAPPAVLYMTGSAERLSSLLADDRAVAVVGARRASPYGVETASSLASGLGGADVTVVSGMALGIDGVAHDGALRGAGETVAVLPGGADRAYPAAHRRLYERIRAQGIVISELPPGVRPRRWMFPARNRIIAGLSAMTVVVQARARSGALVTARHAQTLGRVVGAVPGPVSSPLSAGPHALIAAGARLIAGAQDVLDAIYGPGERTLEHAWRASLSDRDVALLSALQEGHEGAAAFARAGLGTVEALEAVAALELAGVIRCGPGGRLVVTTGPR